MVERRNWPVIAPHYGIAPKALCYTRRMSPAVPLPARITISPDVLAQTVEGRTVLLDLRDEHYYSLDDVGTRIWSLLTEHQDVDRIVEGMLALYQVDAGTIREDLRAFFNKLAEAGLVQFPPDFVGTEESS